MRLFPAAAAGAVWAPAASSLDATCYQLDRIAGLGRAVEPIAARARGFLAGRQRADGLFAEGDAQRVPSLERTRPLRSGAFSPAANSSRWSRMSQTAFDCLHPIRDGC